MKILNNEKAIGVEYARLANGFEYKRVAKWNGGAVPEELGGGSRENTKANPPFDLGLITEEIKEFYIALANDDLVEMVDAYCDVKFVYLGIVFKVGCTTASYTAIDINNHLKLVNDSEEVLSYANRQMSAMRLILSDFCITNRILQQAFDIVCEANDQKGTIKDDKGKTMKGPKWVNPAETIKQLLIQYNVILR